MRLFARRMSCLLGVGVVAVAGLAVASPAVAGPSAAVCSGTFTAPGVLTGFHPGDVVVSGACAVNAGPAVVGGDLIVTPGAVLGAVFGHNDRTGKGHSSLSVAGDVSVGKGATAFLGCDPQSAPCQDDPNQMAPTLSSHVRIGGDLRSWQALAVVVHNTDIDGSVVQNQGGGGFTCTPTGFFTVIGSPVFSAYEDSTVNGSVRINSVTSCWMGLNRLRVGGSVTLFNNQMNDPDAIEINSNHVSGDLVCVRNSMAWNSSESSPTALFPRTPHPNTVHGDRVGQCRLASPLTMGGPSGPGPF